jgi:beta-galactosidase/beta-glucuronidase
VASLGDDWSPTWVEGIVDKLPPAWAGSGPGWVAIDGFWRVSGCCYDVYIHPLEKEQL